MIFLCFGIYLQKLYSLRRSGKYCKGENQVFAKERQLVIHSSGYQCYIIGWLVLEVSAFD